MQNKRFTWFCLPRMQGEVEFDLIYKTYPPRIKGKYFKIGKDNTYHRLTLVTSFIETE